jgi:hypothetical protein
VVDLQETPAVPPFDSGGDERLGYFVAGGLLIFLGWGLGVVANVVLHLLARSSPVVVLGLRVGAAWGPYGWATALFGAFTGAFGAVLVALGRASPRGPLVLPGADY